MPTVHCRRAIATPFTLVQYLGIDLARFAARTLVGIAISVLIIWLFGREMTAKSILGGRTTVQILGFQEFMNRVDADRLKRMPPDTFEKYLPYAMALGVEHRWAHAFAGIVQNPPTWYVGPTAYSHVQPHPLHQLHGIDDLDSEQVFVSAPRASR